MESSLLEMQGEYETIMDEKAKANSIKFQANMMMAAINGIEFLNGRFDPFDIKLDGWGEQINENIDDYDEIFGELHEKYKSKAKMSPELKLLFQLGGSAAMLHMTNTMFKSSMPGMDDIMRQNPELMKQFAEAAVGCINKGPQQGMPGQQQQHRPPPPMEPPNPLAAMMGLGGGGGGNPMGGMMNMMMGGLGGGLAKQQGQQQGPKRTNSPARSDMSGPDGIDDLINKMNLQPDKIPDLDAISLMSGETDKKSSVTERGITLKL